MNILYVSDVKDGYPFIITIELNNLQYQIVVDVPALVFLNRNRLHIVDIDQWIFKETATRYSYVDIVDMAKAFRNGYNSALINNKSHDLFKSMVHNIIHKIFNTKILSEFKSAYRIELLDFTAFINIIDKLRTTKISDSHILPYLINKLHKYAEINSPDNVEAIERIAQKFNVDIDIEISDGLSNIIDIMIEDEFDKIKSDKLHHDADDILINVYGQDILKV